VAETEWVQGNIYSELNNCGLIQKIGSSEFHLNISNMVALISNHRNLKGRIWFDEFHLRTFTTWRTEKPVQWIDGDDLELTAIFQRVFEMHKLEVGTVREAVRLYAHKNRKNEPRDWMSSLVWDKKERCHDFFINACQSENDEYTRTVSKNFWVAMAARVFVPGCKMDNMVILEGRQGAQKSTLLEEIAKEWFTECTEAVGSKDFKSLLSGHLIVEIPELTSLLKAHNQQDIKAALSDRADKYRPSYGRHEILFNRTCVFVGTTNDGEYLADPTGARRYWPIYVNKVDIDYVRNNRDQLFAEAVWRFRENKESWWMVPESAAKEMQETKRVIDPWEEKIEDWLYGAAGYQDRFRMSIVFDLLEIPVHQQRKQDKDRIKHILEIKGYVCKPTRHDGKIERRWCKEYSSTSQV
jgi:putative DNA primase/helicase